MDKHRNLAPAGTVLLGLIWSTGCGVRQEIAIEDVTKPLIIQLSAPLGDRPIQRLAFEIQGKLDGTGSFSGDGFDGKSDGRVSIKVARDWSTTNYVIHYRPENVRSGTLTISYEFK